MLENSPAQVSVVLAVYDKPLDVLQTIKSVLLQRDVDLELIVVLDGASKFVEQMLRVYAKDSRVRIVKQKNRGLTRSLATGCKLARYDYIARIDAGDTMDVNRITKQAKVLDRQSDVGLVTSWCRVQTEEGYALYKIKDDQKALSAGLQSRSTANFSKPVHASVMFRKSVYKNAGGYRKDFYVAQDADLWSRMIESSETFVIPELLTTVVLCADSISGRFCDLQKRMTKLVVECVRLRAAGKSDKRAVRKARALRPEKPDRQSSDRHDINFIIARTLSERSSVHAKEYWWRLVKSRPFRVTIWPRLITSYFYRAVE